MTCRACLTPLRRARPKSLALCPRCTAQGKALYLASVEGVDLSERQRRFNFWWGPSAGVLEALAADRAVA